MSLAERRAKAEAVCIARVSLFARCTQHVSLVCANHAGDAYLPVYCAEILFAEVKLVLLL